MPHTSPLSILQVAVPAPVGGLESVTCGLAKGLAGRGHRVGLAVVQQVDDPIHPMAARTKDMGVEVFSVALPSRAYLREIRALRRVFEAFRPDAIHTHGYRADVLGGIAAAQLGIARVSTAHGFTGGGWKNRGYEWVQLWAARRAEAVIAVSRSVKDRLRRAGVGDARLHLIPNALAVEAPLRREVARATLGIPNGEVALGWVGRLSPEKGLDIFLRALPLLEGKGWRAHVIGEGPSARTADQLATALGIGAHIHWHGIVPEAGKLLTAFDVFVLSSRSEGTPIVLLEAARATVPIVATAVGGVPDMFDPGGAELVPPERHDRIAAAISTILADPAAARARAADAGVAVARRFDPVRWLEAHEQVYARLREARGADVR